MGDHVIQTNNIVLLLTPGLFTRPWCLLEIVTATRYKISIVPVKVERPGLNFQFPDEAWYEKLRKGNILTEDGQKILTDNGATLLETENAIRQVFTKIALTFSPHKSNAIRAAELQAIFDRCAQADVAATAS